MEERYLEHYFDYNENYYNPHDKYTSDMFNPYLLANPYEDPYVLGDPITTTYKTTARVVDSVAGGIVGGLGGLIWGAAHYGSQGMTSGAGSFATKPNYSYFDAEGNSFSGSGDLAKVGIISPEDKKELIKLLESFRTEFRLFKDNGTLKNFKENSGFKYDHKYGSVTPTEQPMEVANTKCRCTNTGPWPHLMHSMDPVENFQSDILIHLREEIDEIKENVRKIKAKNDSIVIPDLKKFLKAIGQKLGVDIDNPVIINQSW